MSRRQQRTAWKWQVSIVVLTALLAGAFEYAGAATPAASDPEAAELVAALTGTDSAARNRAVFGYLRGQKAVAAELIKIVDPANPDKYLFRRGGRRRILLGEMRIEDAVPALAKALDEIPVSLTFREPDPYDDPFATALRKIGRASIPPLVESICTTDDAKKRVRAFGVLSVIYANPKRVTEMLERVKQKTEEKDRAARLEATIWAAEYHKDMRWVEGEPVY